MEKTQQQEVLQSVQQYDEQCLLDKGGQGEVHLMSKNNHLYAVKLPLQNTNIIKFQKEQLILSQLDHQNIIKLVEYKAAANVRYSNKMQTQAPAMILQFAEEGDLFYISYKKRFSQPVCRVLFEQIMGALKYIHEQKKLMHLDMKVENILVDSHFNLKISDFGHAMFYQEIQQGVSFGYGTDLFRPPQYGLMNKFNGQKVDIFNAGMILFQLIVGREPLYNRQQPFRQDKIYRLIKNKKYQAFWKTFQNQLNISVSDNAKRLLMSMLSENPNDRPTINEVFKQQWFVQTNPATSEQVTSQFLSKKQKLLGMKKKQLIQEIKNKFKVIKNIKNAYDTQKKKQQSQNNKSLMNQENNEKQEIEEQQANYRQANEFYMRMYHDFTQDKKAFTCIQTKNKFQVKYSNKNPALLVCLLRNSIHDLFQSGEFKIYDQLSQISPLGHNISIQDSQRGILKAVFEYQIKSLIKFQQDQKKSKQKEQGQQQQVQQQQAQAYVKIQIDGQIVRKEDKFGIQWLNAHDKNQSLWKKQLIKELNLICDSLSE